MSIGILTANIPLKQGRTLYHYTTPRGLCKTKSISSSSYAYLHRLYPQLIKAKQKHIRGAYELQFTFLPAISPYLYNEQKQYLKDNFNQLYYYTLEYMIYQARKIINSLINYNTKRGTIKRQCYYCKKFTTQKTRYYKLKPVCDRCYVLFKQGKFLDKLPKPGKLKIIYKDHKKYIVCHKCRYAHTKAFRSRF